MDVTALRSKIATVNATVAKLREQRVRNMGMRETLEKQRAEAIATYKSAYGVDLSTVDINEEFNRVVAEKESEVNLLTEVIGCIENSDYARANQLLGITSETSGASEVKGDKAVVAEPQVQATEASSVVAPPTVSAPSQTVVPPTPQVSGIDSLVSPPLGVPTSVPNVPTPTPSVVVQSAPTPSVVAPPPMSGLGIKPEMPVAPPPVIGAPPTVHATGASLDLSGLQVNVEAVNRATDFSSILSGQQFIPQ